MTLCKAPSASASHPTARVMVLYIARCDTGHLYSVLSFDGREVRDQCTSTPALETYKPPDFVVQALQVIRA